MAETRKTTLETKVTLKSTFKCRATGFAQIFFIMWDWTGTDYLLRMRKQLTQNSKDTICTVVIFISLNYLRSSKFSLSNLVGLPTKVS